jgi:hypothetical protein
MGKRLGPGRQRATPRLRPAIAPSKVTPTAEAAVQVGVLNNIPPPSGRNDLSQGTGCQLSAARLISSPSAQAKVTSLMTNQVLFQSSAARLMTDEIDEGQGRSLSDGANTNLIVERLSTVTAPNQRCRPCICGLDKLDVQSSHASGQQEINKEESVSDDLSRESVLSFPRDRPEVEVMVGNRPRAPEVGDGDATAQGPNPGTTQHEDSTLAAVGVVGYEVTLDPEAAIFVPRKRELAPVEDAHCHSDEGIVPAVARTAHASASAPRQALVATGPKSLYVKGSLEGQNVRFLVDTGAEVSGISYAMLARLPEVIRAAFQDQAYTVTTVSGERVSSKGPVMCNIMVGGRVVTDAVIAMQMEPDAILSLPTLAALGGQVTVAGVELLPVNPSIRNITGSRVLKVRADGA